MRPMKWEGNKLSIVDQTLLPMELKWIDCLDYQTVAEAIKKLRVRGAPAIGVAASFGLVLGAQDLIANESQNFHNDMKKVADVLKATRPTAVNLFWAVNRMMDVLEINLELPVEIILETMEREAIAILEEDICCNNSIGENGAELVKEGYTILTHCNAGALATAGHGTALGVIRTAHAQGKKINVIADETRPLLQGARLTAWELMQDGIPVTLITDNMAGHCMSSGMVDMVIVGADRITAQGDVANKIGTYQVAVLAKENGIPFYVAAPMSTIDFSLQDGKDIPIEQRGAEEITHLYSSRIAPEGVKVYNPAFDVTPAKYITGIITDLGIAKAPYGASLQQMKGKTACEDGE